MHNKTNVLVVIDKLNTGGVTTSLLNLMQAMHNEVEFSLIIFNRKYSTINELPEYVHVIDTPRLLSIMGMTQAETKKESVILYLLRFALVALSKVISGKFARQVLYAGIKKYGEYDLAISYTQDVGWKQLTTGCNDFVLRNVKASYKVAYIHCDYRNFGGYSPKSEEIYEEFDRIICVSNGCKNSFVSCFPTLSNKVVVCENFTDINRVKELATIGKKYEKGRTTFVTVCRLAEEKGIDRTIHVLKKLYSEGFANFRWVVVGGGDKKEFYKELAKRESLDNCIEFVGEQLNPYYYIKNADYFLLPSFHEAAPMVFGESTVLGVPIITTNTTSATEMVGDRKLGFVCENSENGLYTMIKKVLTGEIENLYISREQSESVNLNAEKQFTHLVHDVCK